MSFAHYLLQVNLYLIVFYGFYKLLLDKETYFTLNRFYLVTAGFLSLVIPFIRLEWLTQQKAAQQVYTSVKWDAVLQQATIVTEGQEGFKWGTLLVYIYCGGIVFFLSRLIFNLLIVNKLIKNAKEGSAFSFLGKKIIDLELPYSNVIDSHEETHIKQWHTLDILFFELIGIITWLNPVIYLYKKAVKNIHEFLADEQAAKCQGDKTEYAMLILSKSFGINPSALTSNFFDKSLVKKRIYMLHKERSKKTAVLKYGISIPLFAIFIVFSSATVRKNEKLLSFSEQIPLEKPIELVQDMVTKPNQFTYSKKAPAKVVVQNIPVERDWKDFYSFLSKTIVYPKDAQESNLQGNALIKFTLRNGKVSDLSTNADLGKGCDEEVMKAILSYKGFKKVENGKYALKVAFRLDGSETEIENQSIGNIKYHKTLAQLNVTGFAPSSPLQTTEEVVKGKVYDFVSIEKVPEFPGGMKRFYEYLSKNMKYPQLAQENNVQGKVWLSFTVERNGQLTDIQITRGLGSGTDEEAKRVLEESPKWIPGIQNGKAVRVKYNININFTLDDTQNEKPNPTSAYENSKLGTINIKELEGNKSPLIILDGITQNKDELKHINPETIESIAVLKDATATAIYGKKAVNGVILVTTKTSKNSVFRKPEFPELTIDKSTNYNTLKQRF